MGRLLRSLKTAAPARPAVFLACAAAHASLIAAFWSAAPLRVVARATPALVYALPAAGTITAQPEPARARSLPPRPAPAPRTSRSAPDAPGGVTATPAAAAPGVALGQAALALARQVPTEPVPEAPKGNVVPAATSPAVEPPALAPDGTAAPVPPPAAARTLPPAARRADLQLAYHRMRAAQDALRLHHAQGEHLAWLQRRVTALLAAAAGPDFTPEGAHCAARVESAVLSVRCDDPALGERLERADGDLAVFLAKLIALTAPGGEVEIAFLPAQPPVVAGL